MKVLMNKKSLQKIIISLVILILFNFIFPVYSRAEWWGGGNLFNPISDLVCGIGDAIICILQDHFLPGSPIAVDRKRPIEFLIERYTERYNNLSDELYAKSLSGTITQEERKRIEEEMKTVLQARSASEQAAYVTDVKWWNVATWIGGIATAGDSKYQPQVIPCIVYSPAAIFANMVPSLDVNFINPKVIYNGGQVQLELDSNDKIKITGYTPNPNGTNSVDDSNSAYVLQNTIATWYKALRNIALVGLLSILVYIAIRIILSATAGETAKYKSMLKDWVVAMCILIFMHYMMAFLLKSSEMLTNLFVSNGVIAEEVQDLKIDTYMCNIRQDVQNNSDNGGIQFGYVLMYMTLVFYTLIFTWKYIKRLVYLAFLTLISPLVALTYPIDKIKDGSAQAFNKWFKEYTFNVLIQPIHMLLYTILITSASSLAEKNMIYAIVALGFMLEAEKIIKDFFGIQTQRGEGAGAVTGGAMFGAAASLMQKGLGALPKGSSGGDSGGSGKSGNGKLRFNDRDSDSDATKPLKAFLDNSDGDDKSSYGSKTREPILGASTDGEGISGDSNVSKNSEALPRDPSSYKTKFFQKAEQERAKKETAKRLAAAIKEEQKAQDKEAKRKQIEAEKARKLAAKEAQRKQIEAERARKVAARNANKKRKVKNSASSSTGQKLKNFGRGASDLSKYVGASKFGRGLKKGAKGLGIAGAVVGKAGWGALKAGGRTFRGVGTVAGRFVGRNGIRMAKFAGRTALKGIGAATLGTIGLAAGLASGDDSAIIKYAGLGLTAGATAGGMIGKSAESMYGSLKSGEGRIQDDFEQGYYGSDYEDKALNPRLDREWRKDKDVQAYYRRKYGSEYRQKMKESLDIRKAGITDQDDIDTALKLVKNGATTDQAANIMQFTKGVTRSDMFSSQKWENMQRLATQMVGDNPEKVDQIMQLVNQRFKLDKDWRPSEQRKVQKPSQTTNQATNQTASQSSSQSSSKSVRQVTSPQTNPQNAQSASNNSGRRTSTKGKTKKKSTTQNKRKKK